MESIATEPLTRCVESPSLGCVTFKERDVILFPNGLIGFEEYTNFTLVVQPELAPFKWLLNIEEPSLCFPVVDPFFIMEEYNPLPPVEEIKSIGLNDIKDAQLYAIVNVGQEAIQVSANLRGPLVINEQRRLGKQIVLVDSNYLLKYPIIIQS